MKTLCFALALLLVLSVPVYAEQYDADYCQKVFEQSPDQLQRGCCSWHNGVCGCQNGRTVCCDGSYSPSCRCN